MPPRQSVRLSTRLTAATTPSQSTQATPAARPQTRPRKKQKLTLAQPTVPLEDDFRKTKGRRGVLKTMTEMPVDILLEIFGQLEPVDLLHLSRATKDLRAIILDDNAKFLWQQVYRSVVGHKKPPPCPSGMQVVHYTNLLYGRHCHFCASGQAKTVHWSGRVRLCSKCAPKQLILKVKDTEVTSMCSSSYLKKSLRLDHGIYILKAEYDHHVRKYNEIQGEEAKLEYQKAAAKEARNRIANARVLSGWEKRQKRANATHMLTTRDNRRQAIVRKLHEEGYGPELAHYRVDRLPGVKVALELTDKGWERIKHNIFYILENERQGVLRKNIINKFNKRIRRVVVEVESAMKKMPRPHIIPPFAHFARSEPFCNLIKNDTIDEAQFQTRITEFAPLIPDLAMSWKSESDNFLVSLIHSGEDSPATSVDLLELAVTFFKCRWCDDPIRYPRVLMHRCLRDRRYEKGEGKEENKERQDSEEEDDEEETAVNRDDGPIVVSEVVPVTPDAVWNQMTSWYGSTWNEDSEQVFVDEEASRFATAIVKACGEDPKAVTLSKMEEDDARLECIRCSAALKHKPRNRLIMNWKMAILHDIEVHYEETPSEKGWQLLTNEEDLAKVKENELKMSNKWKAPDYNCRHCHRTVSAKNMKQHMAIMHNLGREVDGEPVDTLFKNDIYQPLDTSMKTPPYAVKI